MELLKQQKIGLGGGCHWCTEAVFQSLKGVESVEQGWVSSESPYSQFSEAVIISFCPNIISEREIIGVHLRTHASSSDHSFRGKYRSAIYTFSNDQMRRCRETLNLYQRNRTDKIITKILPFRKFRKSDKKYQNYFKTDQSRPFCQTYIEPKMDTIRKEFPNYYQSEPMFNRSSR